MEDITGFDGDLLTLNDLNCFSAYGDDNGFAVVVVMVRHLATGNKQTEHSTETFGVMFFGQNFGAIRVARIWIFLVDILLSLKNLHLMPPWFHGKGESRSPLDP